MKNKLIAFTFLLLLALLNFHFAAVAQPVVTTLAASGVTVTNATLNGKVNPNGGVTTVYFQYGLTTNYSNLGGLTDLPATNATLTLPGLVVNALHGPAGTNWTTNSVPSAAWSSIASSADGMRLAAVVGGSSGSGGIYTSTNVGVTWTLTSAPAEDWSGVASSADGLRLAATAFIYIYTSTNGGVAWTRTSAPVEQWQGIASSADGMHLAAAVLNGGIYTSTNGGGTWTQTSASAEYWSSIASSADGTHLAAAVLGAGAGGNIYTSTNAGASWTLTSALVQYWNAIASSADGTQLAAANEQGYLWSSTNGGVTWGPDSGAPFAYWFSVASSADGTRLTAGMLNGGLYTSTDSGNTWTQGSAPAADWYSIASSADGSQLAAVANGGGIYTSTGTATPLTPGTTYHYRVVALNSAGTSLGNDLTFTTSPVAVSFHLTGAVKLPGGTYQFSFTNLSGLSFTVLSATNPAVPSTNWTVLGAPVESPTGHYQFTDPHATNSAARYYRVRSP